MHFHSLLHVELFDLLLHDDRQARQAAISPLSVVFGVSVDLGTRLAAAENVDGHGDNDDGANGGLLPVG